MDRFTKNGLIEEQELRTFIKCSEFFHFKGRTTLPIKLQYIEYMYQRVLLEILKDNNFDYKQTLYYHSKYLETKLKREGLTDFETEENIRHAVLGVHQIYETIKPNLYIPVFGPFDYLVNISKSNLRLCVSSLHLANPKNKSEVAKRNKTLHAVAFSPYSSTKDTESDLINLLKVYTLGANSPLNTSATQAKLHLFSISSSEELNYTFIDYDKKMEKKNWLQFLEAPVKLLEDNYHYPLVPCTHSCQFKQKCFPMERLK